MRIGLALFWLLLILAPMMAGKPSSAAHNVAKSSPTPKLQALLRP